MKRTLALILAVVMVFALAIPAMADNRTTAGDNTITVNGAQKDETYKLYKMLDLNVDLAKNAYSYTVNADWAAFFNGDGAKYIVKDAQGYVQWAEDMETAAMMVAFGKDAAAYAADKTALQTIKPDADKTIVFEGLANGYYLVTSSNGTNAMVLTTPDNPAATVAEKNPDATLDKTVQEDSTNAYGEKNTAQIGDTVNFKIVVAAKDGAKNYVVHDKMTDGLTFNAESVSISDGNALVAGTDYTVVTETADGCTFEIVFEQAYLNTIKADTDITITYSAELNSAAAVDMKEKNDAKLTWGDKSESAWDETVTETYKITLHKFAKDITNLAGAKFELQKAGVAVKLVAEDVAGVYHIADSKDTNTVTEFVTLDSANIVIKGLDNDSDYTLVETEAPDGYNKLAAPVAVTVETDNSFVADVENQAGKELPTTGGIGTTIFYVVGSVMVLAAVVVLVSKKRMGAEG